MVDELLEDNPMNDAKQKFSVEIHNHVMDKIIENMTSRFVNNSPLYTDLSLLSSVIFDSVKKVLPEKALKTIFKN
jgi:hypothetical protein